MPAKYPGVAKNKDGSWGFRLKIKVKGKQIDTDRRKDKDGKPFMTAKAAYDAKIALEQELRAGETPVKRGKHTVEQVYHAYLDSGLAKAKAPATIRKHESIWENHLKAAIGDRYIDDVTIAELESYLHSIYARYSYKYTESHLKLIVLIWGYADKMEWIDSARYHRMMHNRGTRLTMPAMRQDDIEDELAGAVVYSDDDLRVMKYCLERDEAHLLTAFLLSLYTGVRISENFALRWSDIDWDNREIKVTRQMHYHDSRIVLASVKTMTSIRSVPLPDTLRDHLLAKYEQQTADRERLGRSYRATEQVYDEVRDTWITGGDFISRKRDGMLLTTNSVKYWARKIKDETDIELKFHWLRHTFATNCAAANIPIPILMTWMGHKKISTTQKYYLNLADNKAIMEKALRTVEHMYDLDIFKTCAVPAPALTPTQQRLQNIEQRQHILLVQELMRRDQESNNEDN